jgi:hypothetical protein
MRSLIVHGTEDELARSSYLIDLDRAIEAVGGTDRKKGRRHAPVPVEITFGLTGL